MYFHSVPDSLWRFRTSAPQPHPSAERRLSPVPWSPAAMSSSLIDGHEVRLVVFEICSRVGVLDGEAKGARELGKRSHVGGIVQKLCEFPLKVVVARHQIEDAFLTLPYWS